MCYNAYFSQQCQKGKKSIDRHVLKGIYYERYLQIIMYALKIQTCMLQTDGPGNDPMQFKHGVNGITPSELRGLKTTVPVSKHGRSCKFKLKKREGICPSPFQTLTG